MLSAAYASSTGFHQQTGSQGQQVLAIRGTDWSHGFGQLASDLYDDARLPGAGLHVPGVGLMGTRGTTKYQQAKRYLDAHPEIDEIIGHSLGASVAIALGQDTGKPYRVYSSPSVTWQRDMRHRRRYWDPISIMDRGAEMTEFIPRHNPHGFRP
jgi:hypothetical protein